MKQSVLRGGFRGCNAVYCMNNGDLPVAREAKSRGLLVVVDQVLTPDVGVILREERSRFPGVERQESEASVNEGIERDRELWSLADLILAPADYTRDAIVRLGGAHERIASVPYGVSTDWVDAAPKPERGRVLFVGSVGLRKGTHYLAEAARLLRERGVECEVCVVGPYDPAIIQRPEFRGPTYLGRIPRSRVREEFLRADVFVHPSLAEGCAIASLEALACGLPMVVTPNAGTVVRDGIDGFVVPARDGKAIAEHVAMLVADRNRRGAMSEQARERAGQYTWGAYQKRLVGAFSRLTVAPGDPIG